MPTFISARFVGRYAIALLPTLLAAGCSDRAAEPANGTATSQPSATRPAETIETAVSITEMSATELLEALAAGELSALEVTQTFLDRIESMNHQGPRLHAVLELNPGALAEAEELDRRLLASGPVGSLHGVPVLIKGNIDIAGLKSSAGSLALAEGVEPAAADAFLVAELRAAGAVILGTANLSEWANFRDQKSSSGWSSQGGQTRNPHVLDRNPCGSSSGSAVAVAARLAPLAIGTETNGSIVCPASANGVVGIKPTLGLVSRRGIIPISSTQDTAGPMARSVGDAARLLEAITQFDAEDPVSIQARSGRFQPDPANKRLDGIRIGVLRTYGGVGERPRLDEIYQQTADQLAALGATLIDPIEYQPAPELRQAAYRILLREFKATLNEYLVGRSLPEDRNSLADLIAYNETNADRVMPIFEQSIFIEAEAMGGLDEPEYAEDIANVQVKLRADLDALFGEHTLDALLLPGNAPAWKTDWVNGDHFSYGGTAYLAAISGYPSIVLPVGQVAKLPVAAGLMGRPFSEASMIQIAYALEQALPPAPEPQFMKSLENP
jgi:amidase